MTQLRKWLILTHRYVGIALSLIFVSWFASGIAMLYGRGMPRLTSDLRLERLAPVDVSAVRLSAAEAFERAELSDTPNQVTLLTVMGRPAYRFGSGESTTVFADTGELLLTSTRRRRRPLRRLSSVFPRIAFITSPGSRNPTSGRSRFARGRCTSSPSTMKRERKCMCRSGMRTSRF